MAISHVSAFSHSLLTYPTIRRNKPTELSIDRSCHSDKVGLLYLYTIDYRGDPLHNSRLQIAEQSACGINKLSFRNRMPGVLASDNRFSGFADCCCRRGMEVREDGW